MRNKIQFETVQLNQFGEIIGRSTHTAEQLTVPLNNDISLKLVAIPGGEFMMGSPPGVGHDDERPYHPVTIDPFWMGIYPITQAQWKAVMGVDDHPSRFKGPNLPIDNVNWLDAQAYCQLLTDHTSNEFYLPSEAQWEFACRAGTTTPFYFGETITTEFVNFQGEFVYGQAPKGIYRHVPTNVGSFPPNAFGLFDMHGNVLEWCADPWHKNYEGAPRNGRVWAASHPTPYSIIRGGSWHDTPDAARSATRIRFIAAEADDFIGFRVAMSLSK
ncbi:MAG: formylglycine-generating enzyme family protein [Chloroflexi bacterium]|nr:MAG: formylglycine-generating enzyme family protein [Chloroflexota bacterium]